MLLLLVHNERFEVLIVEPVQLDDHVTVSEMGVLIYPHDEESGKCVDDQITQFKPGTMKLPLNLVIVFMVSFQLVVAGYFVEVIRRLSTEPVGIRAFDFHQRFIIQFCGSHNTVWGGTQVWVSLRDEKPCFLHHIKLHTLLPGLLFDSFKTMLSLGDCSLVLLLLLLICHFLI